ncbi:MAG: hypothetical protein Q7S31_03270 [bacterium]|nr:hypothetical protein [bacterium]
MAISVQAISKAIEGRSDRQLEEMGLSPVLALMIRFRYATQLREDVYRDWSEILGIDISADSKKIW